MSLAILGIKVQSINLVLFWFIEVINHIKIQLVQLFYPSHAF